VQRSNNNVVRGNYIERKPGLNHLGHGFGIKTFGENNLFENNVAESIGGAAFEVRGPGVKNNIYRNNLAQDTKQPFGEGWGIALRESATDNLFENHTTNGVKAAVAWAETGEGTNGILAQRNEVKNSTFNDSKLAVLYLSRFTDITAVSTGDSFSGLTIDGAPRLFMVESIARGGSLTNSTIQNVASFAEYGPGRNRSHLGFSFSGVDVVDNAFTIQ